MRRISACSLVVVAVLAAACGSSPELGEQAADSGQVVADAAYGAEHTLTWGPLEVAAQAEDTMCIQRRLGNDAALRIGKLRNQLGPASHHLVVYRLASGDEILEPTPCTPFEEVLDPSQGAPLGITQIPDETITLPPGVAFTLAPDQLVRIEMHFINAAADPIELTATTTFVEIPEADFRDEADFLFIGNPDIELPPMASATVGPSFLGMPPELTNINVFALTGHQHQWGTGVEIALASEGGPDTTVYAPADYSWSEPPTEYFRPPFVVEPGMGFRFSCSFTNQSSQTVGFGESANDEMCFFWAYYYPSNGAHLCLHSDQYGIDGCCPGHPLCSLVDQL